MNWLTGFATRGLGSVSGGTKSKWRKRKAHCKDIGKPPAPTYITVDLVKVQQLRSEGLTLREVAEHEGYSYNQMMNKLRVLQRLTA